MTTVTLQLKDGREAHVDGEWVSVDARLQAYLRVRFPLDDSPSLGTFGAVAAHEAAAVLGGHVTVHTQPGAAGRVH